MTARSLLRRLCGPLLWLALLLAPPAAAAQAGSPLSLSAGGAALEWRPVVRVHGLLADQVLADALHSGLPLRVHLRVELWEKGFINRLAGAEDAFLALLFDPLDESYTLETGSAQQRFARRADAEAALNTTLTAPLRPRGGKRYYYLATLEVETLSLSDLQELQRWLRGEARPAVEGRAPVGRAVERGLRRALVRVVGLPTRRYEARTPDFRVR